MMNSSVYIFGSLLFGYSQYPDDDKKRIFKTIAEDIGNNMIAIRRDGNLLYYVYVHPLSSKQSNSQYIGFAIEFNGLYYNDVSLLFRLFEESFTNVVLSGKFVEFDNDGEIIANTSQFYYDQAEVNRVAKFLMSNVNNLPESGFRKLPPVNYSIGLNESAQLSDKSTIMDIDNALVQFNVINIFKENDDRFPVLAGYSEKIKSLSGRIKALSENNARLADELVKTRRQKKRTTVVTILSLVIAMAVILIISSVSINTNLTGQVWNLTQKNNSLQAKLKDKEKVIETRDMTMRQNTSEINTLRNKISDVLSELNASKSENENLVVSVNNLNSEVASLNAKKKALENQVTSLNAEKKILETQLKTSNSHNTTNNSESKSSNASYVPLSEKTVIVCLRVGQAEQLTNGTIKANRWESDNTEVAIVTPNGLVIAVGKGKTNIWGYFGGSLKRYYIKVE